MENVTFQLAANMPGVGRAGEMVTLSLEPTDVHVPEELPNYLAGYKPFGFRADDVSPVIPVDNDSDYYRTQNHLDTFEAVPMKVSTEGRHAQIDLRTSTTKYTVVRRAIGVFINAITEQQSSYNVRQAAMKLIQRKMFLDREIDVMAQASTTTNFASANRFPLAAGSEWNGGADSDPIKDLQFVMDASAQEVTEFHLNLKQAFTLLRHPATRDQFRMMIGDGAVDAALNVVGKTGGMNTKRDFTIPGIGDFRVHAAKRTNATTGVLEYVFPTGTIIGVHNEPGAPADMDTINTLRTFRVRGAAGVGYTVREYLTPDRGAEGGTMLVASQAEISVVTANNAGGIISGAFV